MWRIFSLSVRARYPIVGSDGQPGYLYGYRLGRVDSQVDIGVVEPQPIKLGIGSAGCGKRECSVGREPGRVEQFRAGKLHGFEVEGLAFAARNVSLDVEFVAVATADQKGRQEYEK